VALKNSIGNRIEALCDAGCATFVCLQSEVPPQTHRALVMGGYEDWKQSSLKIKPSYYYHVEKSIPDKRSAYIHYGMRSDEGQMHSLNSFNVLIEELKRRIDSEEVLYIHCDRGKDRTDLLAAALLGRLYADMGVEEAVKRTNAYCETRNQETTECFPSRAQLINPWGQKEEVDILLAFRIKYVVPPPPPLRVESESNEVETSELGLLGGSSLNVDHQEMVQISDSMSPITCSKSIAEEPVMEESNGCSSSRVKTLGFREEVKIDESKDDMSLSVLTQDTEIQKDEVVDSTKSPPWSKTMRGKSRLEETKDSLSLKSGEEMSLSADGLPLEPLVLKFSQVRHSTRVLQMKNRLRSMEVRYRADSNLSLYSGNTVPISNTVGSTNI